MKTDSFELNVTFFIPLSNHKYPKRPEDRVFMDRNTL